MFVKEQFFDEGARRDQHLTNFWTHGFRFTVRALKLHNVKHTSFTSTIIIKKKHLIVDNVTFKATWMPLLSGIMFQHPQDALLCVKAISSAWLALNV